MKTTEIRVRPVIRHAITRYTNEFHPDRKCSGGSESLGEFSNEAYAEEVAAALAERAAPKEYVMVQQTMGEVMAKVFYAYSDEEAENWLAQPKNDGESYRVYSRIHDRTAPR